MDDVKWNQIHHVDGRESVSEAIMLVFIAPVVVVATVAAAVVRVWISSLSKSDCSATEYL